MSDLPHNATIAPDSERKRCEQCNHRKLLTEFHRRQNKTGDNRMRICAKCYRENLEATRRRGEELARLRELERQERDREEQEKSALQQQQQRERAAHWPEKACIGCNQKFPMNERGHLVAYRLMTSDTHIGTQPWQVRTHVRSNQQPSAFPSLIEVMALVFPHCDLSRDAMKRACMV